ncbi:MAG: hypothetical protein QXD03_03775 [Candidatus Anstonellales archaeon]
MNIKVEFIVPTSEGLYKAVKNITNEDQFYYYLYLSSIKLPDSGICDIYYFTFREKKKYDFNENDYMICNEFEYVFHYKFTGRIIEFSIIPGTISLMLYSESEFSYAIINDNDTNIVNSTIDNILYLNSGCKFSGSNLIMNISTIVDDNYQVIIEFDKEVSLNLDYRVDKAYFVNFYERNLSYYNDVEIYNYGNYVKRIVDSSKVNIAFKKFASLDSDYDIVDSKLSRYYNSVNIDPSSILFKDKKLSYFTQNPYNYERFKHLFLNINPYHRVDRYIYDYDYYNNILKFVFVISKISNLKTIYLFRKIPGLRSIKFYIKYIGREWKGDFDSLKSMSNPNFNMYNLNMDIMVVEEDFIYQRFIKEDHIYFPVPESSNTVVPILLFCINYKDVRYLESYLFCELEIDYDILIRTIDCFGDIDLWEEGYSQKCIFLTDRMLITDSPIYYSNLDIIDISKFGDYVNVYLDVFKIGGNTIYDDDKLYVIYSNGNYLINGIEPEYFTSYFQSYFIEYIKFAIYMVSDNRLDLYKPSIDDLPILRSIINDRLSNEIFNVYESDTFGYHFLKNRKIVTIPANWINDKIDEVTITNPSMSNINIFLLDKNEL